MDKPSSKNPPEQSNAQTSQNSKVDEEKETNINESFELINEIKGKIKKTSKHDFQEILNAQYMKGIEKTKERRTTKIKIIIQLNYIKKNGYKELLYFIITFKIKYLFIYFFSINILIKQQPKEYSDDFESPLIDEFNDKKEKEEEHKNFINELSLSKSDSDHIKETLYKQHKEFSKYESIEKLIKKIMNQSYGKLFENVCLDFYLV